MTYKKKGLKEADKVTFIKNMDINSNFSGGDLQHGLTDLEQIN